MAKLHHCGADQNARTHRLASNDPRFAYQILYNITKCKGSCHSRVLKWVGELESGGTSDFFDIRHKDHEHWLDRIISDEAKPEMQLESEYSQTIKKSAELVLGYLDKIQYAQTQGYRYRLVLR